MPKTAEEIKAAKAKEAADEAARKAAQSKDQESDDEEVDDEDDDSDESELEFSPKQKAYVEKLRKEAAKTRIKAKELETQHTQLSERFSKFEGGLKSLFKGEKDEKLSPEERIERLEKREQEQERSSQALELANALKEAALEHGVGKADLEYFEFLVGKKLEKLGEDEELSDDDLKALAKQAKAKSAAKSTSVDNDDEPSPDEDDGEISLDEFQEMGIGAKSALYQKDKPLYEKLAAQDRVAKKKK